MNALTFDVEDYFQVQAFADVIRREHWDQYPSRVEINTYRVLEILGRCNIRATFFILGWIAQRCAGLVRDIQSAGHEIGSHGYHHQMIGRSSHEEFRGDVVRAKAVLEDQLGSTVSSYRAPSYSITARTLWALDVLGEAGFERDSSIFPVLHDHYGIPDAPRFPHYRQVANHRVIVEFPPSTLRCGRINVAIAGGGYFRLFPYSFTSWGIHRINTREHQPAMVYLHPWEFDPDQPRIAASWRSRIRHYQNLRSTESKFRRLLEEFSWAPMSEVLARSMQGRVDSGEVVNVL